MRRTIFIVAAVVILVSAMITYSILALDKPPKTQAQPGKPNSSFNGFFKEPASPKNIQVNLKPSNGLTELILKRYYTYCGHTDTENIRDSSLFSLSKEEILKLYPGWRVKESLKTRLVLFHRVEDLCPLDMQKKYVGEKDGYVTIFYGEPGQKFKVFKVTEVPTKNFPLQIKAQLEQGIKSESEDHLVSVIEGLEVYNEE